MNAGVYFVQMLKIFARIMANFLAMRMRPHPHGIRLCTTHFATVGFWKLMDRVKINFFGVLDKYEH